MAKEIRILTAMILLNTAADLFAEPSASVTPKTELNAGQASAQIDLGNLYFREHNFQEAEAAYLRALQSTDPNVRQEALMALEQSLRKEHNYLFWLRKTGRDLWEQGMRQSTLFLIPVLLLITAWFGLGYIGERKGAKRCVIRATNQEDPDLANVFRLAYLSVLIRQKERKEKSGPVGSEPITPTLESSTSEALLPQLLSITDEKVGKIAAIFSGRLNRPRYRLSVSAVGKEYATRLVISLEAQGKVVEVWSEELSALDLFEPNCRFLRKIVAYVDGYAATTG